MDSFPSWMFSFEGFSEAWSSNKIQYLQRKGFISHWKQLGFLSDLHVKVPYVSTQTNLFPNFSFLKEWLRFEKGATLHSNVLNRSKETSETGQKLTVGVLSECSGLRGPAR